MSDIHNMTMTVIEKHKVASGWQIGCLCGWDSGQAVTFGELAKDYNDNQGHSTICKVIYAPHGDQFKKKEEVNE